MRATPSARPVPCAGFTMSLYQGDTLCAEIVSECDGNFAEVDLPEYGEYHIFIRPPQGHPIHRGIDYHWTFEPPAGEQPRPAEAMLDELEAVKTKIDERPADPLETNYRFKVNFLQSERRVNEDLSEADSRLFEEYTTLELNRPLDPAPDARWRWLRDGLFDFKG